ncbi:hypothetical protein GUITHDRAFT_136577 [Guillardia theta CCMP2712]|uniref:Uncharacterized protein n=1 Tax=Guillardia theta (strain CCMP2712) TaxID=905079 RepID=L1JJF1_GUITC|nr:hypothetical protein GUITHDRAFT_136577 [Guillardia theta CCMP2712]EKX48437.1 hypothetical protein GUITHDRAFT_136577 [Guillardia theta CCMP2712]|eukprot:XP_005835417.1 hypothetical protein GUITHDRAFT_136577 [Guillardia theta CCMP2712]
MNVEKITEELQDHREYILKTLVAVEHTEAELQNSLSHVNSLAEQSLKCEVKAEIEALFKGEMMISQRLQKIEKQLNQTASPEKGIDQQLDASGLIENLKSKILSLESMISEVEWIFKMPDVGLQSVGTMISFCKDKLEEHDKELLLMRASRTAELSYEDKISDQLAELSQKLLDHGDLMQKQDLRLSGNVEHTKKLEFELSQLMQLFGRVDNCESMLAKHQTTIPSMGSQLESFIQALQDMQSKMEMIHVKEPFSAPSTKGMNLGLFDAESEGESELSLDDRLSSIENALILLLEAPEVSETDIVLPEGKQFSLQSSPIDENKTMLQKSTKTLKGPVKTLFDHIARIEEVSRILCHHGTAIRTIQSNQASWKEMTMKVTDCISLVSSLVSDIKILRHGDGSENQIRLEGPLLVPSYQDANIDIAALNFKLNQIQEILDISSDEEKIATSLRLNTLNEAVGHQQKVVDKLNEDLKRWSCSLEKTLEVANEAFGDKTPFAIRSYVDCIEEDVKDCHLSITRVKEELLQSQNNFELQLYALEQEVSQKQDAFVDDFETLKSAQDDLSNRFAELRLWAERSFSEIALKLARVEEAADGSRHPVAEFVDSSKSEDVNNSLILVENPATKPEFPLRVDDAILQSICNRIASLENTCFENQMNQQADDDVSANSMESGDESPTSRSESISYNARTFSSRMSQSSILRKLREDVRELKRSQQSLSEQMREDLDRTYVTPEDLLAVEHSLHDALKAYDDALADIRAAFNDREDKKAPPSALAILQEIPRVIDVIEELITDMRISLTSKALQSQSESNQAIEERFADKFQLMQQRMDMLNADTEEMGVERENLRSLENLIIELEGAMEARETENAFLDERVEKVERMNADLCTRVVTLEEKAMRVEDFELFKSEISRDTPWFSSLDSPLIDRNKNRSPEQETETGASHSASRIKALAARVRGVTMSLSERGQDSSQDRAQADDRRLLAETAAEIQQWEIRTLKEQETSETMEAVTTRQNEARDSDQLEFV